MVKFVPVSDVERPKAAQNLQGAANDKHRKFDNPHTVSKTVDRGWKQGNVGWGVLGAFGNSDKDDAAQVMKHAEGANKMIKNEKGLWVKVKSVSLDITEETYPSRGRGRGGGTSVFETPPTLESSGHKKMTSNDEIGVKRSNDRPDSRFRDVSESRNQCSDRRDSRRDRISKGSRSRSRSRSKSRSRSRGSRYKRGREQSRSRSSDRKSRGPRRDRSRDGSKGRNSRRSSDRSRSRSKRHGKRSQESGHRKSHDNENREQRRPSRHSPSQSRSPSNSRRNRRESSKTERDSRIHKPSESSPSSREITGSQDKQIESTSGPCSSKDSQDSNQVFEFLAIQLANRFLEVFSGSGLPGCSKKELNRLFPDTDDDDDEKKSHVGNVRLDSIASLFVEEAAVLSMKTGKFMLSGKSAIRGSFARTTPEACRCSFRIVVSIPASARRIDRKCTVGDDESEVTEGNNLEKPPKVTSLDNSVSFCLDFHAPNSSPGLGDRSKDTCLLYRCENSLLTHIWGAVDPDKLSSAASKSDDSLGKTKTAVLVSREVILRSKCWVLSEAIIKLDYPSFSAFVHDGDVIVYHDYNTIESWG